MSIIDKRLSYKPFEYQEAYDAFVNHEQSHWVEWEVQMSSTVQDWSEKLSETDRKIVAGVLLGFTQSEVVIGNYWSKKVGAWFPKPEIEMMANSYAAREGIHISAYNKLSDTLGLEEHDAFIKEPTAAAKLNNLIETPSDTLKERARSLAIYSGFGEGVSLYSSFAILLHFSTRNTMKGLADIIAWSVRDECHGPNTEVLTSKGWVKFADLTGEEKLAQFDMETKEISFTKPLRLVTKHYDGKMIRFGGEKLPFKADVTENHDMVVKWDYAHNYSKRPAKELKVNPKMLIPLAGYKTSGKLNHLSTVDRFRIALQADGSIPKRYTGELCGTIPVLFTLSKQRKIDRLVSILDELKFNYSQQPKPKSGNIKDQTIFKVHVPIEHQMGKTFSWVNLEEITAQWAREFVDELKHWDGHISEDFNYIYYSSVIPENLDVVQAICALGGMSTSRSIQIDERSESYSDVHRLYIHDRDYKRLGTVTKEVYDYNGLVYCATVEKGTLITRYENSVSISGNCAHSDSGCWLYRQLIKEYPELTADGSLEEDLLQAIRLTVQLEFDFIDMVFGDSRLPAGSHPSDKGLGAPEVKAFIEHRANLKLYDLGLPQIFTPDEELVGSVAGWFYPVTAGLANTDFFAQRVTNYAKGNFNVDNIHWDKVFLPFETNAEAELVGPSRSI